MFETAVRLLRTRGRANRAAYWKTVFLVWLGLVVLSLGFFLLAGVRGAPSKDAVPGETSEWIVGALFGCCLVYGFLVFFAVAIRRLHDRDRSGWWLIPFIIVPATLNAIVKVEMGENGTPNGAQIILLLITFGLSVWSFAEIGCLAGTDGDNRFGTDPVAMRMKGPEIPDAAQPVSEIGIP